jgi:hypothetical protein
MPLAPSFEDSSAATAQVLGDLRDLHALQTHRLHPLDHPLGPGLQHPLGGLCVGRDDELGRGLLGDEGGPRDQGGVVVREVQVQTGYAGFGVLGCDGILLFRITAPGAG